jgi:hypothetical protein
LWDKKKAPQQRANRLASLSGAFSDSSLSSAPASSRRQKGKPQKAKEIEIFKTRESLSELV